MQHINFTKYKPHIELFRIYRKLFHLDLTLRMDDDSDYIMHILTYSTCLLRVLRGEYAVY